MTDTTTRIWEADGHYYMSYAAAVLAMLEKGYTLQRDADPTDNERAWLTRPRDEFFGGGVEDAHIGWIDAQGRCPACAAADAVVARDRAWAAAAATAAE